MKIKTKTKKSLEKRIKLSKNGKIQRKQAYTSHRALGKTTKQKRHLKKSTQVQKNDSKRWKNII